MMIIISLKMKTTAEFLEKFKEYKEIMKKEYKIQRL